VAYKPTPEQAEVEAELATAAASRDENEERHKASVSLVRERARRLDELGVPRTRIAEVAKVERSYLYAEILD
jgi:hypothetical protein